MPNFMNKVSQFFGQKDLTQYPVYYRTNRDISYNIMMANSAVLYDTGRSTRSVNWNLI
jgi:hypothetical protein